MKAGHQHDHTPATLRALAAFGVKHICSGKVGRGLDDGWSVEDLKRLRQHVESFGLALDCVPLPLSAAYLTEGEHPEVLLDKNPERDRTLELLGQMIRNCGAAGIPMVEALGPVGSACDHAVYAQASETMRAQVAQGSSLNETMALSGLFPSMVVQMCAIGEETGAVDRMLARAGALLENEVTDQLAGLSSLLEPVIMVLLGCVVGAILVALYLPIFKLGQIF